MSSYFEYVANGDKDAEQTPQPQEAVVQDQDTVIGDAMCHASQMIYDCARNIANCINENNQGAINLQELKEAEKALCYMEGVDFGLAMDDKSMKWYMCELEKCIASIEESKDNGFQTQVYLPSVKPSDLFGFDEEHCRNNPVTFLHTDLKFKPRREYEERLKKELAEDKHFSYLFKRGVLDPFEFPGAPLPEVVAAEPPPQKVADSARKAEDDSQSVLSLRNLFRQNKIDKSQYVSALATLVATGLISKSEFTRLKTAAN